MALAETPYLPIVYYDKAELDFFNLNRAYPDRKLYQIYIDRIIVYRKQPPGDEWDGVFTHTSK